MKIQSLSSDPRADGTSDEVFVVQINSIAAFIFFFFKSIWDLRASGKLDNVGKAADTYLLI